MGGFCFRGLGQSGTWAIGDLVLSGSWDWVYNRGLGPVGELDISGIWLSGSFVIGDLGNGDLGNRGLGPIGELELGLQSGTWACRGVGSIGEFVIGEFLSGKRLSGTWAIGLTS